MDRAAKTDAAATAKGSEPAKPVEPAVNLKNAGSLQLVREEPKPLLFSFPDLRFRFLFALAILFCYVLVGTLVYKAIETNEFTTTVSVYFCFVTMSTVGYGDFSPTTTGSKVFTIFMIFIGIIVVFAQCGKVLGDGMRPISAFGRSLLGRVWPEHCIDINGDGVADFHAPRRPAIYYLKGLLPSILMNAALQLASAGVFVAIEDWDFGTAFYHCLVTATTVGYGDIPIRTDGGRQWACAHIMISVILLADLFTAIGDLREERKQMLKKLRQLFKRLDDGFVEKLMQTSAKISSDGGDETPNSLTEHEYVICMLLELEYVELEDVQLFLTQFRSLDVTGDRRLDTKDLQAIMTNPERQQAAERALEIASRAIGVDEALSTGLPRKNLIQRLTGSKEKKAETGISSAKQQAQAV